jgi:predicted transposase YbfD/YdcC
MLNMSNEFMQVGGKNVLNQDVFITENSFVKMLFVIFSAIVANANSPEEIEDFAYARKNWIKKNVYKNFIGLKGELISALLGSIRPDAMSAMVERWLREVARNNDGSEDCVGEEAVANSFMRASGFASLGSAWLAVSDGGLVFGKRRADAAAEDGNFVANVIDLLDLDGALVSIDADGVHPQVAADILGKGGDYLVAVTSRQKKFYNELVLIFNYGMVNKDIFDYSFSFYTDDCSASEILSIDIINDMFWIQESNMYADAKSIIRVVSTRIEKNRTKTDSRYYVSSVEVTPEDAAYFKREFWLSREGKASILDVCPNRQGHDARVGHLRQNMASLNTVAQKLFGNGEPTPGVPDAFRKKAAWDGEFLTSVLSGKAAP